MLAGSGNRITRTWGLIPHVLLGADEGVVADMHPSAEGEVDVGDGEENEGDEDGEEEDLDGVKGGIGRAEERGGGNGDEASDEKDCPEDMRKNVGALQQAGAAMLGEGA